MVVLALALCLLVELPPARATGFQPTKVLDFGTFMADVVVDDARVLAYVSARDRNSVLVLSLVNLSLADEISVGAGPWGMDMDPATDRLYVALDGDSGVAVVDLTSRTLFATWPLPLAFGVVDVVVGRPGRIYASGGGIWALNTTDGSVVWSRNDLPGVLAMSPDKRYLYSAARYTLPATAIKWDVSTDTPQVLESNRDTNSLSNFALSPDGTRLYLAVRNWMTVLDTENMTVAGSLPCLDATAVAVTPDWNRVLGGMGFVYGYAPGNGTLMDSFLMPYGYPRALAMDAWARTVLITQTDWTQSNVNRLLIYTDVYGAPPETTLVLGAPSTGGPTPYATNATPLSFTVVDRSGTGIRNTSYRVDGGPWRNYTAAGPFTLAGEGGHLVEWFSEDFAGGVEPVANETVRVDGTPPETTTTVGPPTVSAASDTFVTSASDISLAATDRGATPVGLATTEYRVDASAWTHYSSPFTLAAEGRHTIDYRSMDLLGNTETARSLAVIVDDTPPAVTTAVGAPSYQGSRLYLTSASRITLGATDGGAEPVGLASLEYCLGGGNWTPFASSFTLSGPDGPVMIEYRAADLLGNVAGGSLAVVLDDTPPSTTLSPDTGPYATDTVFTLAATDGGSGVSRMEYRVDGGPWIPYAGGFSLPVGDHVIRYRSMDPLNNTEAEHSVRIVVENGKPLLAAVLATILAIIGAWSARRRPWASGTRPSLLAFALTTLPFLAVEAATGIVSLAVGTLTIPPVLGVGTAVDSAIFVAGLAVAIYRGLTVRPSNASDR